MENTQSPNEASSSGILIGILIVVVIGIVAWIAYAQGVFTTKGQVQDQNPDSGSVQINLGGSSATPDNTGAPAN